MHLLRVDCQGGVFNRWEYVVAGPPISQIAIAEPLAEPGETVVSPEAWELVKHVSDATSVGFLVHSCADKVQTSRRALSD